MPAKISGALTLSDRIMRIGGKMAFNTGTVQLDAVVLAVVAHDAEGTYGYKITQDVRKIMDVSESTLYPVLRRLQKDNFLETYDKEFSGRNRRYYRITQDGILQLDEYRRQWIEYRNCINALLLFEAAEQE